MLSKIPEDQRHDDHYDCAQCGKPLFLDPDHPEWEERDTDGAVYHEGCLKFAQEWALDNGSELPLSKEQLDKAVARQGKRP